MIQQCNHYFHFRNCKLKFDTHEDLNRHQKKFCVDSDYGNVTRLERKLHNLNTTKDPLQDALPGLSDIKQYLRGSVELPANSEALPTRPLVSSNYHLGLSRQPVDQLGGGLPISQTYQQQQHQQNRLSGEIDNIRRDRQAQWQQRSAQEEDMRELLKELEQRKERELRAQIEKEEIMRGIKDLDRGQLTNMEREKKRELEKLAAEREALRNKEQNLMDEVKRMENQLLEQEKHHMQQQQLRDSNTTAATRPFQSIDYGGGDLRQKELYFAKERGAQVAHLKTQREKLEMERERIMQDLDNLKIQQPTDHVRQLPPRRNNEAALMAADVALKGNLMRSSIEPSLKDKLISDQVKINRLKQQQKHTYNDLMPEMDDLDVLQKELEGRNYIEDTQRYVQHVQQQQPEYLGMVRQRLENQAAAPSSSARKPQQQFNPNASMDRFMQQPPPVNYETIDHQYSQTEQQQQHHRSGEQHQMLGNLQTLKDNYLLKGGEDSEFITKVNDLENFLKYRKPLPANGGPKTFQKQPTTTNHLQQPQPTHKSSLRTSKQEQQQPQPPPVFQMPPMQQLPQMPQQPDPMVQQMQMLMQQQEQETQRLKQALESLSGAGNTGQIDQIIERTTKELEELKHQLSANNDQMTSSADDVFDEDFVFRQNEFRSEDLDPEERALMNLAAQEYDALRILSKLPKNSEVYNYKMQQYREMSTMRAEMEKLLQEQRLEKIRREFEKRKYEEERKYKHETWLEEQKKRILEAKISAARQTLPPPQTYQQPSYTQELDPPPFLQTEQQPIRSPLHKQQTHFDQNQDDSSSFILGIDYVFNLPREYRQLRLVYSICLDKRLLIQPRMIDLKQAEADMDNTNKVFFNVQHIVKEVKQPHQNANLIVELQIPDPNKTEGFSSLGWTVINVFEGQNLQLNTGMWKLPIYRPPTVIDLQLPDVARLNPLFKIFACIRICMPNDQVFSQRPTVHTHQNQYELPYVHNSNANNNLMKSQRDLEDRGQQQPFQVPPSRPSQNPMLKSFGDDSGIQLVINYVKGIKPFSRIKVQATLYEGVNIVKHDANNTLDCNWATSSQDSSKQMLVSKGSQISIAPNGQLQIQRPVVIQENEIVLPIAQEVNWMKAFSKMLREHQMKDNLYLLLQVFLLPPVPAGQMPNTANFENIGYTVLQLNNPDSGLRYGDFEQPLYKQPISFAPSDPTQALPYFIRFAINKPKPLEQSMSQQQSPFEVPDRPHSKQFIPNFDKQWSKSDDFQPGDGIDVYVDWARFLPDNTLYTKVFARVIDINCQYPVPGLRGYAHMEVSTARNPFFGFKFEVRNARLNPTLLLIVSFETLDKSNNKPCYAGHSYFPLFMDKVTELPIKDPNAQNYTLHKGAYQMPVYCQAPLLQAPLTYEKFLGLERIPTCSMLIRILKAPRGQDGRPLAMANVPEDQWEESGVVVNAPVYQEGVYNTQYFLNTPLEARLFPLRRSRPDTKLTDVATRMMAIAKQPADLPMDRMLQIINQLIAIPSESTQMIDMNYFTPYNAQIGFRFGVECIHNNTQQNVYYQVIASLCPTASFYDTSRTAPPGDSLAFNTLDWQGSTHHTQKFTDGQYMLQNIQEVTGMSIILDVKRITAGQKQYENFGFTVMPLFSQLQRDDQQGVLENYVNSGIFQLPIYQGQLPQELLQALRTTKTPLQVLQGYASKLKLMDTTIIVKIVDNQRERHFAKGFEQCPPSLKYMPIQAPQAIQYKPQISNNSKQLAPPNGNKAEDYQNFMVDTLNKQFKL